jgi:hypothetical protein
MILERICVDTQTATDDILKTREDIQKVQDAVLLHLDGDVDVVSTAECLQVEPSTGVPSLKVRTLSRLTAARCPSNAMYTVDQKYIMYSHSIGLSHRTGMYHRERI